MKQIVLLRHGQALSFTDSGTGEDSKRPLSETGKDQAAAAAKELLKLGFLPEIVIVSPYLRAAETAAIVSAFFPETRRLTCEALACGDAPSVIELLALELKTAASALIVGHQPLLGTLGGFLLNRESFSLTTGGFIYLKFKAAWLPPAPPESELIEFFTPEKP
jgi:phosphohistidine phosphatase